MTSPDFTAVTELAGDEVSQEQVERICRRYYWAASYCEGKDVLEVACGAGQGLGLLDKITASLKAGDFSEDVLAVARAHYGARFDISRFDAMDMPFEDNSLDVVILFEAIYYLPDASKFIGECVRVLRPGGRVLIATANPDLYDFNPSPHTFTYFGVVGLRELFEGKGFTCEFFGDTPLQTVSLRQKILRPIKKIVVSLGLMPKTMAGKRLLKRLVFGELVAMPAEINSETAAHIPPHPLVGDCPSTEFKVVYCSAALMR